MQALVDDLLIYSRVASKARPLAATDSTAVMQTVLHSLSVAIEESGARIRYDALPVVLADATQLAQLLQNLITNAIKFRGAQVPQITVRAQCFPVCSGRA